MIRFLILILALEFVILLTLVTALIVEKIGHRNRVKRAALERSVISEMLIAWLNQKNRELNTYLFSKNLSKEALLSVLEKYNRRFNDENWQDLKELVSNLHLLPQARQWAKSLFWKRRLFSARCFALFPLKEDEPRLIVLMDDPVFLVRNYSAQAIARLGRKGGIIKIINQIANNPGYSHYFYSDLLLEIGGRSLFKTITELASETDTSPSFHLACLELLASNTMPLAIPFLKNDLVSKNQKIRLAALKVYSRNPQSESPAILLQNLQDPDPALREQAAAGLAHFSSKEVLEHLEATLHDKVWKVRLQAALSLKQMGRAGLNILENQPPEIDTATYALQFDG